MINCLTGLININWKKSKMIKGHHKIEDSILPDIMELGSCRLHLMSRTYSMALKDTDWGQKSF